MMIFIAAKPDAIVVCPTEYGGQIEHAADTAMALASHTEVRRVTLLSRPGADQYLGNLHMPGLSITETVPPRRHDQSNAASKLLRAGLQIVDLFREHVRIRHLARLARPQAVIVLDSAKYPWPQVRRGHREQRIVLFVHNARPHFGAEETNLRRRFILRLERSCIRNVDRVITHGQTQQMILQGDTGTEVVSVNLPLSTRISQYSVGRSGNKNSDRYDAQWEQPYALCIGEVRSNKGIEYAIAASVRASVPLRIFGKSEDAEIGAKISRLAQESEFTTYEDRFLTRSEFNASVERAAVVVLPYLHFDAQSGVLSKAMHIGARVVASDLPALRDQAGAYPHIVYGDVRDCPSFGDMLRQVFEEATKTGQSLNRVPSTMNNEDWDTVADAILARDRNTLPRTITGR